MDSIVVFMAFIILFVLILVIRAARKPDDLRRRRGRDDGWDSTSAASSTDDFIPSGWNGDDDSNRRSHHHHHHHHDGGGGSSGHSHSHSYSHSHSDSSHGHSHSDSGSSGGGTVEEAATAAAAEETAEGRRLKAMAEHEALLEEAKAFARAELGGDSGGHDWWHVARVAGMAKRLAALEGADAAVCELAAWLHDVADEKLNVSKEAGLSKVEAWLVERRVEDMVIRHVMEIISTMSYGGGKGDPMRTAEGKIVQDADRLDALGAVGIARTFAYSGWKGQAMYDPEPPVRESMTAEQYRKEKSTAVNHFYEKLAEAEGAHEHGGGTCHCGGKTPVHGTVPGAVL
ncbi:HD domain-containing protein [Paenibacillus sp. P25]|nr:HD domain-containing protein [Paenibacillus sp. P25]